MQFNFNVSQQQALNSTQNRPQTQSPGSFSPQFTQVLINVVALQNPGAVAQSNKAHSQAFQKDKVKTDEITQKTDEENESVYVTVHKMEQKLIKLARLERQMLAGF